MELKIDVHKTVLIDVWVLSFPGLIINAGTQVNDKLTWTS